MAAIWRALLEQDDFGRDDNFFDVGGQSLLAMRVWSKLREAVPAARDLATVDLFAFPTIAALATRLAGKARPSMTRGGGSGSGAARDRSWTGCASSARARRGPSRRKCGFSRAVRRSPSSAWRAFPGARWMFWANLRPASSRSRGSPTRAARTPASTGAAERSAATSRRAGVWTASICSTPGFSAYNPREAEMHRSAAAHLPRVRHAKRSNAAGYDPDATTAPSACTPGCGEQLPSLNVLLGPPASCAVGQPAGADRQRGGLLDHARLVQADLARAERDRADGVLDVAGRGAPRLPEPARARVRHRAGRRRVDRRARRRAATSTGGRHPLARRPLPRLRRGRARHGRRQRRRRRRAQAPRRCAGRRRHTSMRCIRGSARQQRRRRARSATPRRASTVRPTSSRGAGGGRRRARDASATSRRTAPARRSAIRSRWRR